MPEADAKSCKDMCSRFLLHYTKLHVVHKDREWYHLTIKFHYMYHLGEVCKFYNPRWGWNYADEDFVGRVARIAKRCAIANGPLKMTEPIFERLRTMWHVNLQPLG